MLPGGHEVRLDGAQRALVRAPLLVTELGPARPPAGPDHVQACGTDPFQVAVPDVDVRMLEEETLDVARHVRRSHDGQRTPVQLEEVAIDGEARARVEGGEVADPEAGAVDCPHPIVLQKLCRDHVEALRRWRREEHRSSGGKLDPRLGHVPRFLTGPSDLDDERRTLARAALPADLETDRCWSGEPPRVLRTPRDRVEARVERGRRARPAGRALARSRNAWIPSQARSGKEDPKGRTSRRHAGRAKDADSRSAETIRAAGSSRASSDASAGRTRSPGSPLRGTPRRWRRPKRQDLLPLA